MVHDLLPLALRGVKRCGDRFLAIGVVARDVKELAGCTRHAVPESMDEGCACHVVLQRRDGVIVSRTGELGAALGEVSYVLV
jgi:folate-dependent phosphoribosylglycinamide formyltransferase PurN